MNEPAAPALTFAILAGGVISLAVLFRLFQKHIAGEPLLAYEPRRAPPWNFVAPLLMLAPLLLSVSSSLFRAESADPTVEVVPLQSAVQASGAGAPAAAVYAGAAASGISVGLARGMEKIESTPLLLVQSAVVTMVLALSCYALLALVFGASRHDLGIPQDRSQLMKDVGLGVTAFAASLAPIYLFLFALNFIFPTEEGHPLIQELLLNHSPTMMGAAALTAVVAAPLYEETAFRLVLQGWLERREALSSGLATAVLEGDVRAEPAIVEGVPPDQGEASAADEGLGELSPLPGWGPVVISGTLFGLAHVGQGLSPAPLILLGLILGYLYQRTHRIVPCITCHLLFNGYTFLMLTLQFSSR